MLFKLSLCLLIACCLSTNGYSQIEKTVKGVPCSYDTCISIEISNYRHVRQQFINRDSLITSLKQQIYIMENQEIYYDSLTGNFRNQLKSFNNSISRKDSLILDLKHDIDELVEIKTTDPKRWYQRPSTWISGAAGILLGVLLSN
jgi:hypothetical protein